MCALKGGRFASCHHPFAVFNTVPLTYLPPKLSQFVTDSATIDLSLFVPLCILFWQHRVRRRAPNGDIVASRRCLFALFNTVPLKYLSPKLSHFIADSASIDLSLFVPFCIIFWQHLEHGRVSTGDIFASCRRLFGLLAR